EDRPSERERLDWPAGAAALDSRRAAEPAARAPQRHTPHVGGAVTGAAAEAHEVIAVAQARAAPAPAEAAVPAGEALDAAAGEDPPARRLAVEVHGHRAHGPRAEREPQAAAARTDAGRQKRAGHGARRR